ncbi:MAG: hypothetical protein ACOC1D_03345 [Prolixibacteraceae bacterium]
MWEDFNSELSKITDKYLERAAEASGKSGSVKEKTKIGKQFFNQLVDELLDQTSNYMIENNISDSKRCTEIVQSELERYNHDITRK